MHSYIFSFAIDSPLQQIMCCIETVSLMTGLAGKALGNVTKGPRHYLPIVTHQVEHAAVGLWCRYVQQAARAVNQAMGRVIRHKYDYGAILLADERFGTTGNQRQLSKWLRTQLVQYQNFGQAIGEVHARWARRGVPLFGYSSDLLCEAWIVGWDAVAAQVTS